MRISRNAKAGLTGLGMAAFGAATALAQPVPDVRLDWHTIDGGGTMFSSGRSLQLGGTLGQADAGPTLTGRGIELTGGFWVVGLTGGGTTCLGDLNGDGQVSLADLSLLLSEFGCIGAGCTADLDNDDQVALSDLSLMLSNFGTICP